MQTEAIRLMELRTFCYWTQSYLQRVLDTTPVPHAQRVETIIRELRQMTLLLPVDAALAATDDESRRQD